jgi:hypothetical protein
MEKHLAIAEAITNLLENRFKILNHRFGLDPVLGLIPGLGDVVSLVLSFYLIWIGIQLKLPTEHIDRMVRNILIDFVIGIIPFVGEVGDFVFKANTKNLRILKNHAPKVAEAAVYT